MSKAPFAGSGQLKINREWLPPVVLPDCLGLKTLLEPDGSEPRSDKVPDPLGKGTQGICFLARTTDGAAPVVVKWLWPLIGCAQPRAILEGVLREAGLTALPSHPHIIRTFKLLKPALSSNGQALPPGIVMERFDRTLHQFLGDIGEGALDDANAVRICRGIAEGLRFLHNFRLVHRDLVPANVAITVNHDSRANEREVSSALADLSTLAVDAQPTELAVSPADNGYMAPERTGGPPRKRWDIYSFGRIVRDILSVCRQDVPILSHIASRCLSDPLQRPTSDELCDLFDDLSDEPLCAPVFDAKRQTDCYLVETANPSLPLQTPAVGELASDDLRMLADNYRRGLHNDVCGHTDQLLRTPNLGRTVRGQAFLLRAAAQHQLSMHNDALDSMRQAMSLLKESPACNANRIVCQQAAGHTEQAREQALRDATKWPENARTAIVAGLVLGEANERKDAITQLGRAAEIDPASAEPWHVRACILARCGEVGKAIESCQRAIERDSHNPLYQNQMGVLLARKACIGKKDPDEASLRRGLAHFERAVFQSGQGLIQNTDYVFNLAVAQLICGDARRAISTLVESGATLSNDSRMLACLGECYLMTRQWDDAIKMLRAAMKRGEHTSAIHNNLSVALLSQGETKLALQALKRVSDADTSVPSARINMALCFLEMGDPASALTALEQAEALGLDSWKLHYLKSKAAEECGDWQTAILHADGAARRSPRKSLFHQWVLTLCKKYLPTRLEASLTALESVLPPLQADPHTRKCLNDRIRGALSEYAAFVTSLDTHRDPGVVQSIDVLAAKNLDALTALLAIDRFLARVLGSVESPDTMVTSGTIEAWVGQVQALVRGSTTEFEPTLYREAKESATDTVLGLESETRTKLATEPDNPTGNVLDATSLDNAISFAIDDPGSALSGTRLKLLSAMANAARGFEELRCLPQCRINVYEHQIRAALSVLYTCDGRALLADDVGLGKTVEAGIVIKERLAAKEDSTCLIIVPGPLVEQWRGEMMNKFSLDFAVFSRRWDKDRWNAEPLVIASLSRLKRPEYRGLVKAKAWDILVVDEAHHARRPGTLAWRLLNKIRARDRLLLTATPIQNRVRELHALINLAKPGLLGTYGAFRDRFVASDDTVGRRLNERNVPQLRRLLASTMIRTRRDQTCIDLPRRKLHRSVIELSPEERALYCDVSGYIRHAVGPGAEKEGHTNLALYVLERELCSSPHAAASTIEKIASREDISSSVRAELDDFVRRCRKLRTWTKMETLRQLLHGISGKTIVFTEFTKTATAIVEKLVESNIEAVLATGATRNLPAQIAALNGEVDVLVTTQVGGEGHNLQVASNVVNFDFPWNPMRIEQRIGRVHRIEQTKTVHVYNFATCDTIEDYVVTVLQEKLHLFERVMGEAQAIMGMLKESKTLQASIQAIVRQGNIDEGFRHLHEEIDAAIHKSARASLLIDECCIGVDPT
ncbi:MAG TPA: SNF2-related protein [Thermoguttaceae bacterium]|nr:SNF2-related protein [Thermoguttaceae bacterium]